MMQVAWFDRDRHQGVLAWIVPTKVPLALQPLLVSPAEQPCRLFVQGDSTRTNREIFSAIKSGTAHPDWSFLHFGGPDLASHETG